MREFIKKAEQTYQTLLNEQGVVSAELLKSHLNGTIQPIRTLMEMAAEELELIKIKSAATTSNGSIKLAKFKNKKEQKIDKPAKRQRLWQQRTSQSSRKKSSSEASLE